MNDRIKCHLGGINGKEPATGEAAKDSPWTREPIDEFYGRANKDNPFGFDQVTREEWETCPLDARVHSSPGNVTQNHGPRNGVRARGNVHPTVKGIEMMMYLIKLSGGDKIGDLCFGSGGTAIACQLLGLDFVGAELCPEAVTKTQARLAFWWGLSSQARDAFKLTGEIPESPKRHDRNLSLFTTEIPKDKS